MGVTEMERRRAVVKRRIEAEAKSDLQEYALLEQRGIRQKFYPRHRDGGDEARWDRYIGRKFEIVARATPMEGFPMWVIEFADGFRMAANRWEVLM